MIKIPIKDMKNYTGRYVKFVGLVFGIEDGDDIQFITMRDNTGDVLLYNRKIDYYQHLIDTISSISENDYIEVIGKVLNDNNQMTVEISELKPIDINEFTVDE